MKLERYLINSKRLSQFIQENTNLMHKIQNFEFTFWWLFSSFLEKHYSYSLKSQYIYRLFSIPNIWWEFLIDAKTKINIPKIIIKNRIIKKLNYWKHYIGKLIKLCCLKLSKRIYIFKSPHLFVAINFLNGELGLMI